APAAAAAKAKKGDEPKKRAGPRVEFRERVSYETETKDNSATMHTAPEQPSSSAGEGKKRKAKVMQLDETSRGREHTRTTQNTREFSKDEASKKKKSRDNSRDKPSKDKSTVDESAKRSKSRNSDMSRTG
ncbi:hypothetical protein PFISCL1PPCAC_21586, partial [Pristionchus fissidentatus]